MSESLLLLIKDAYQAGNSVMWIARDLGISVDMVARVVDLDSKKETKMTTAAPMEMSLYYVVHAPGRGRKIEMLKGPFGTSAEAYEYLRTINLVERAGTYVENSKMKVVMASVGIVGVKE